MEIRGDKRNDAKAVSELGAALAGVAEDILSADFPKAILKIKRLHLS